MAKFKVRRDRILFLDVEMTCWDGPPPEGEVSEIIEFGLAEVDVPSLALVRTGSFLVRPESSAVSPFCERLTGITAERLRREGRRLSEAVGTMKKEWGIQSKAWMSWGSDRRAVAGDCERKQVPNPFSEAFHDLGMQFSLMSGANASVGLREAAASLGVGFEGRHHSGEDDAAQTARIWIALAARLRRNLGADRDEAADRVPGGGM